ncbi:mandelate racemase [Streptosporangium subroseum]|uniref:Mandelate racemase n=1 Tax=Streptosporangium subroseum TaxID=106412 RepID=A0A239EIE2_9ACTN|nr:enolase C-terminal domain-like protein [Streptosporangium subroseum]SNS44329.1 mandelate racemase [Streptosporangium subroseum]
MTILPVISEVRGRPVVAPMARPFTTASGSVPAAPLLLLDVITESGVVGHSYVFGYTPAMLPAMASIVRELAPELIGEPIAPTRRTQELQGRFRLLGMQGLLGMVVSGIDMALWDALGKLTDQPVAGLLGGEPVALRAYDSYGMVDPQRDERALRDSIESGFQAIKIKIGYPDAARDVAVVRWVREIIGPDIELMVDYNQSLNPPEACRRVERLREFDLYWVEEPVAAEDLAGHSSVRRATGARVQTGENWWFPRGFQAAIAASACDFAMFDIMKIGGFTGWMLAAGQAQAVSLPVSSHFFVEASAHAMAVTPTADWMEYLDLAGAILLDPCRPVDGHVTAAGPGLGITWNEKAIARYAV